MLEPKNKTLFFETPEDKWKAFQSPKLVMFSEGNEVESWNNTQPLYFYPFSWLDYLNKTGIRELYIIDSSMTAINHALNSLKSPGEVHFEDLNIEAIKMARNLGHKISVICNLEGLVSSHIPELAEIDFIRIRVTGQKDLNFLSSLPNEKLLSCIKVYAGENCDYKNLAIQARDIGFNLFHVAKRLVEDKNPDLAKREREVLPTLMELESKDFKVMIPSFLDKVYAERFKISQFFDNTSDCSFANYRSVLYKDRFYPCYTKTILSSDRFRGEEIANRKKRKRKCDDCACIYENDMLNDIENKMGKYKNPHFALEYKENGR